MNKYSKSSISVAICLRWNVCRSHITTDPLLNSVITDLVITNLVLTNEHTVIRTLAVTTKTWLWFSVPNLAGHWWFVMTEFDCVSLWILCILSFTIMYQEKVMDIELCDRTNVKLRWHILRDLYQLPPFQQLPIYKKMYSKHHQPKSGLFLKWNVIILIRNCFHFKEWKMKNEMRLQMNMECNLFISNVEKRSIIISKSFTTLKFMRKMLIRANICV